MLLKKAQGLSITTIIVAVIGLIILVVIIMMITSKLGAFGEGLESAASCENVCKALGTNEFGYLSKSDCARWAAGRIAGTLDDEGKGCCCYNS